MKGTGDLSRFVVGIGASAGGIEAFKAFFENLPPDTGLAFVVILHLPVDRKSLLPEILARWTAMPVIEAVPGSPVRANSVYLPPPGVVVTLRDGCLFPQEPASNEPREVRPIDVFFDSLARSIGERAIGVVLSGTGSDGALGLKSIKALGGLTIAQGADGSAPQHGDMPASAIATGAVDIVAPVEAIPSHILRVYRAQDEFVKAADSAGPQPDNRLAICEVLRKQVGHDFSGYKEKTFLRRVQRRMQVCGLVRMDYYVERLRSDRAEAVMLFRDLLIGVTSFFRDSATFELLSSKVFPQLFDGKGEDSEIRVWVPGCATGEEAYSLAMLLIEYIDTIETAPRLQIFASDIDDSAIATARTGRYPATLLEGMPPDRLSRFFTEGHDGSFTIAKQVRELCTFSAHSLTRDPPFSRIHLISCRNLLIYLDTDLQGMVIPAFHYSLAPDGFLLLGSSETVSRHENLFVAIDRHHRIFKRRNAPTQPLQLIGRLTGMRDGPMEKGVAALGPRLVRVGSSKMTNRANNRVLERFAPPFVVVTADGDVVQYSNRIGRFLEPAPGSPSQNVLMMARRGLRAPLRTALKQAQDSGRAVERNGISVSLAVEGVRTIKLAVEPLHEPGALTLYLIVFVDEPALDPAAEPVEILAAEVETGPDRHLEAELRDTREQLQSISEEYETALEELKSSNEELHSVNEELQSTNEELETSKEEIQSINEELQTVNGQLSSKVDELDGHNTDLKNLFESTQVATIFLDPYLVIRGFTPAVASIYSLIPSDQGRPLTNIVSKLRYDGLRADVAHVLHTIEPLERRLVSEDGTTHYLMRILPYRTPESSVDGTLITFVDVTSIVQAEQHQRLLVDELNHRVKNMLTVVISMAIQTMRGAGSLEAFSENFLGRIYALNAAYSLLSNESWQRVAVRDLITEGLKPFMTDDRANVLLQGPQVSLEPQAALAMGLAMHELTTNAVKHGALSVPDGKIRVIWHIDAKAGGDQLVLEWAEANGPPVKPPSRRGLGLTLIERGVKSEMSGEVAIAFNTTGLHAILRAPVSSSATTSAAVYDAKE